MDNDIIIFGETDFRNQKKKFGIKLDDRRRHVYIIGKTGTGKTTLAENMAIQDIQSDRGVGIVDPHGEFAEKMLDFVPANRINDVIYFNPADLDFPIAFNVLEKVSAEHRHLVASGLMGVFKKIWPDVWSPRMEYILNNSILALLENPGNTLLGINRLLVDRDFRVKMVGKVKDPVVKSFWITEFEQWEPKFRTEAIAPIQNKVGQFLATSLVRNVVAQVTSTIVPRKFMDESKIFIVNLSKGRIGEDAMKLLGGMLITKMQLSAMERVDTPEIERADFYLYIDEFQNFATESFASILSEARKYRLALIMAHQYIEQLTEEVRDAVFGNVGTILTFRVGSPDALFLENEFMPRFTHEDLVNLAKYEIYLRLMIDGVASEPFSANTLPPIAVRTDSTQTVVEYSRKEFSKTRKEVEEGVLKWSNIEAGETAPEDIEKIFDQADAKRKAMKKFGGKPVFEYTCSRCGKDMVLPVELDRSRPIYCEDCIEIVREERKQQGEKKEPEKKEIIKVTPSSPPPLRSMKPQLRGSIVVKPSEKEIGLSALRKDVSKPNTSSSPVEQKKV